MVEDFAGPDALPGAPADAREAGEVGFEVLAQSRRPLRLAARETPDAASAGAAGCEQGQRETADGRAGARIGPGSVTPPPLSPRSPTAPPARPAG